MELNFLKRAITSIFRNPGKAIILLLLIFILGVALSGALSVVNAVHSTNQNIRRNMRPIVTISYDEDAALTEADEQAQSVPISIDLIRQIGDLEYVRHFDYSLATSLDSFELSEYTPNRVFAWTRPSGVPVMFTLMGTSRTGVSHIEEGVIELVAGRTFAEEEMDVIDETAPIPTLISYPFAEVNNLMLEQVFSLEAIIIYDNTLTSLSEMFEEENIAVKQEYQFKIIGIFDIPNREIIEFHQLSVNEHNQYRYMLNRIYIPNQSISIISDFIEEERSLLGRSPRPPWVNSIFLLHDPFDLKVFREEVESLLPDGFIVEDLSDSYDAISSSLVTIEEIANGILWVSIFATLLILSLFITLFLRDRRYEMGVYLALGEKRSRIISQILIEVMVVAVLGTTLAILSGNIISRTISRSMLHNELTAIADKEEEERLAQLNSLTITTIVFPANTGLLLSLLQSLFLII